MTVGTNRIRRRPTPRRASAAWLWPGLGLGSAAIAALGSILWATDPSMAALAIALLLAAVLAIIAVTRFEWFVLLVLCIRPALDGLKTGGALEPGPAVGLLFIAAGVTWLATQRRAGMLARPSAPVIALSGLAVASGLSAVGSETPIASAEAASKIAAGVLMFVVIEQLLIRRRAFARGLAVAISASFGLPAIAAFTQVFAGSGVGDDVGLNRLRGTFVHPNPFAAYLVMVLLFSLAVFPRFATSRRWLLLGTALTSGTLLMLTYTRSAWIAAVVGMAFLAWKQKPGLLWLIPAGGLLLLLLAPSMLQRFGDLDAPPPVPGYPSNSFGWRIAYWTELVPEGLHSPVTGLGIDSVRLTFDEGHIPHSLFVQSWVEMGLLGLVASLTVIVVIVASTRRRLREAEAGDDRSFALAAAAVGLALLVQMPSENLLTQATVYWYAAACMTIGYERSPRRLALHRSDAT